MARTVIILMWLAVGVLWLNVAIAHADRDATQLTLARAAVGECGWLLPDCEAALWHTMQRRAAMVQRWRPAYTLRQMVLKYCASRITSESIYRRKGGFNARLMQCLG